MDIRELDEAGTKGKIILAAVDMFAEIGYASSPIREITKKVGIQSASFYNHFESKEALLLDILQFYDRLNTSCIPSEEEIETYLETISGEEITSNKIIDLTFYKFPEPASDFYSKILKILYAQGAINPTIKEFWHNNLVFTYHRIAFVLNAIKKKGLVQIENVPRAATALFSIVTSFATLSLVDEFSPDEMKEGTTMFEQLKFLLDLILGGYL